MIGVLLVDDHAVVRVGFRMLLEVTPDVRVVGEAEDGDAACRTYARLKPDVVVMDLAMPGIGGLQAVRRLLATDSSARILALSAYDDAVHPKRVLKAGALGYLCKREAPQALLEAVRAVAANRRWIDPAIAQKMALDEVAGAESPLQSLSGREFDVFLMLARGRSVAEIAADLKLSASTVGTHMYHIKQKLQVTNQAEITLLALRHELIEP
jgi:two-component system invasion response regulator UvrY